MPLSWPDHPSAAVLLFHWAHEGLFSSCGTPVLWDFSKWVSPQEEYQSPWGCEMKTPTVQIHCGLLVPSCCRFFWELTVTEAGLSEECSQSNSEAEAVVCCVEAPVFIWNHRLKLFGSRHAAAVVECAALSEEHHALKATHPTYPWLSPSMCT